MEKNKKYHGEKYWENEKGEVIFFGGCFLRCFDSAGKLQLGTVYFDKATGEKKCATKLTIDRNELCASDEGVSYLRQLLDDWEEVFEAEQNGN